MGGFFEVMQIAFILLLLRGVMYCSAQKFEDPAEGKAALEAKYQKLSDDLVAAFRSLEDDYR